VNALPNGKDDGMFSQQSRKTNQLQNIKFKKKATVSFVNGFTQGRHSLFKRNVVTYKRTMKRVGERVYQTVPIFGIIHPFTSTSFAASQADHRPLLQGVNNFQGFLDPWSPLCSYIIQDAE